MGFVLCCNFSSFSTNNRFLMFTSAFQQQSSSSTTTLARRRRRLASGGILQRFHTTNRAKAAALAVAAASDWTSSSSSSTNNNENNIIDPSVLDPLIVCGPSGVGKGTIIERFMSSSSGSSSSTNNYLTNINKIGPNHFGFTTSHTTRKPRPGEINGIHYHFVSDKNDMKRFIEMGKFLEHAEVHGNYYGTSWDSLWKVQEEGKRCLLDIDVQGVKRVKSLEHTSNELSSSSSSLFGEEEEEEEGETEREDIQQLRATKAEAPGRRRRFKPKYIFIAPPSLELLEQRLIGRGTESPESLQRRTQNAKEEVEYGLQEGVFDYVLVNDDLEEACKEFEGVVKDLYGL